MGMADRPPVPSLAPERPGPSRRRRLRVAVGIAGVLLTLAAGLAVPNLLRSNLNANESAAIATLKNISSAQSQCQASGVIDVDGNESGEYGFFGELAARVATRGGRPIGPPLLSSAFGTIAGSRVTRAGYVFQIFLPSRAQLGVAEDESGGDPANDNGVDPGQAEMLWCCYAWPQSYGWSGKRTFFVNQSGDVLATNATVLPYDGDRHACGFAAAFCAGSSVSMAAAVAANTVAQDGNFWVVV